MRLNDLFLLVVVISICISSCNNVAPNSNEIIEGETSSMNNGNTMQIENACSYYGGINNKSIYFFNPDIGAEHTTEKIMKLVSLPSNFTIKSANVENAVATIIRTDSNSYERFILYNPTFMGAVKEITGNNFSEWSILAHEIGHHLSGHTLTSNGDNHRQELEADEFSGFVMFKMGAALNQAQSAINELCTEEGSYTHPPKSARLTAIANGWYNAKNNSPNSAGIIGGEVSNNMTYEGNNVLMLIQSTKTGEFIKQDIIGTKPLLKYSSSTKKWKIYYTDEKGKFTTMEMSFVKETEEGSIMKDTYGTRYDVKNGVNTDGILLCNLLDISGEALVYISFEGLKRK